MAVVVAISSRTTSLKRSASSVLSISRTRSGRVFRRQRRDVEAIPLEPARPAGDSLRLHVVRGANQIHHARVAHFITGAAQDAAAHAGLRTRADLDAGDVEGGPRGGRLAQE